MPKVENEPDLVFVHLSDIHFREGRMGDRHDTDAQIRHELQRDLRSVCASLPKVDGLIVSGDIAFGGKENEYDYAYSWLESVRELVNCPVTGVMVTPGNHDVDRDYIKDDSELDRLHAQIRQMPTMGESDALLANSLRDKTVGPLMLSSHSAYNVFANKYKCGIAPLEPFWERTFPLGFGKQLRFRGITSTLISGPRDNLTTHRMLYGGAQLQLLREDAVHRVIIGHHPPSWSIESDDADRIFGQMSVLQLFGHKHDQWISRTGGSIRVIAGAIHPDRLEPDWQPRYSVVALRATDERHLQFRIFPRRWSKEEIMFIGDYNSSGHDHRDYSTASVA